jgi:Glucosamine-6-phosphate isomerases/6-phosphogluconolactonase
MAAPDIAVHAQPDVLAAAAAARLLTRLVDLQAAGTVPKVVLTGGGVGIAMLEQVRATVARDAVDWSQVEFYWATSGSCRPATRNATRRRPGRRCWTTSRSTRRRCSNWAPTPGPARPAPRRALKNAVGWAVCPCARADPAWDDLLVQGVEEPGRELWDAAQVGGHLVPAGSMFGVPGRASRRVSGTSMSNPSIASSRHRRRNDPRAVPNATTMDRWIPGRWRHARRRLSLQPSVAVVT